MGVEFLLFRLRRRWDVMLKLVLDTEYGIVFEAWSGCCD